MAETTPQAGQDRPLDATAIHEHSAFILICDAKVYYRTSGIRSANHSFTTKYKRRFIKVCRSLFSLFFSDLHA